MGEEQKIARRDWAKYSLAAAAGLVVGGAIGYVAKPAEVVPGGVVTKTETLTTTVTGGAAPTKAKKYTFYVVDHGEPGNAFWAVCYRGLKDAVDLLGGEVEMKHTYTAEDYKKQADNLKTAVDSNPDGILMTSPADPLLYDATVREGVKKGIPFLTFNCDDPRPPEQRMPYMTYFGEAMFESGTQLARDVIRYVTEHGTFKPKHALLGNPAAGHIIWETRLRTFGDVLNKEYGTKTTTFVLGVDPAKIPEMMRASLLENPDIDCIATFGWAIPLCAKVFSEVGKTPGKDLYIATFDPHPEVLDMIGNQTAINAFDQQQYLQGYLPIIMMYQYKEHNFALFGTVCTGPFIINEHNVATVIDQSKKGYR